jgi:SAM-dependent methyltransferase
VIETVRDTLGAFFYRLNGTDPLTGALDHLDPNKCLEQAGFIQHYESLSGKRVLEIGSGYGTALAVFSKVFGADAYGIEPDGEGFASSLAASRHLLAANGIDPGRVLGGVGERLPFPDASFDLVHSCNVLEHTQDPGQVLREAVRVLRPGGLLHFEIPNHLSYFEGHYLVLQPPLLWKGLLPFWIRFVHRRDPAFARTLRTEINPLWCRRAVRRIGLDYPLELVSLGEEHFLQRLASPFRFEMGRVAGRIGPLIQTLQRMNVGNWVGRLIVMLGGHYPIHLTLRRKPSSSSARNVPGPSGEDMAAVPSQVRGKRFCLIREKINF